jgi:hypothetical protein
MVVLSMSKQEFSRLDVLLRVQSGRLRVADACALMGPRRRQMFRLLRGLKQDGATRPCCMDRLGGALSSITKNTAQGRVYHSGQGGDRQSEIAGCLQRKARRQAASRCRPDGRRTRLVGCPSGSHWGGAGRDRCLGEGRSGRCGADA